MRSLRAKTHQGNVSFGENAGMQCTAIALIALLLAQLVPVDQWNNASLNDVLFIGNSVYSQVVRLRYGGNREYLLPSDLPSNVYFHGLTHSVQVTIELFSGVVGQEGVSTGLSLSFQ